MSALDHTGFASALPLTEGLLDWTKLHSPDTWHEIASRAEFGSPRATIDLLLALNWIAQQPACDRATALLILTRAAQARLHTKDCPAHMAPPAAKAFCKGLHSALKADCFLHETIALSSQDLAEIDAELGDDGPFALTQDKRRTAGQSASRPAYAFVGQRPVLPPLAA
jgi:hypothetical protein